MNFLKFLQDHYPDVISVEANVEDLVQLQYNPHEDRSPLLSVLGRTRALHAASWLACYASQEESVRQSTLNMSVPSRKGFVGVSVAYLKVVRSAGSALYERAGEFNNAHLRPLILIDCNPSKTPSY